MLMLGPIGFSAPWLLASLAGLPVLWFILRALPPAPRVVRFPGTALLVGLTDPAPVAQRTPWWLLLLRMAGLAALILGLSGPVWRPAPGTGGTGPLLIVVDAGWAASGDWSQRVARARAALSGAGARPVGLLIADGRTVGTLPFTEAAQAEAVLRAAAPAPWPTQYPPLQSTLQPAPAGLETLWLSDGLDHPGRAEWLSALNALGPVRVVPPPAPVASLTLGQSQPPALTLQMLVAGAPSVAPVILAQGPDPQGIPRVLARLSTGAPTDAGGVRSYPVPLDLPPELRNRVTRFEVEGIASAGSVWLADERTQRRKVGLVGPSGATEGQALLSPLHYLREALAPRADLIEGSTAEVLQAAPDVIVLADTIIPADDRRLVEWVRQGGTVIRFAGPRMAGSRTLAEDPLLPVRLRAGGRDIGGALSWGDPRGLAPFTPDGPFAGLGADGEVRVRAQLMAEPAPELASRVLAQLSDATPLVTRRSEGEGQIVLFHVTASADWSDLPLSGLFVQMLTRLVEQARLGKTDPPPQAQPDSEAVVWNAEAILDGFGRAASGVQPQDLAPVSDADLLVAPRPGIPAGLYAAGERRRAVNAGAPLVPASWPGAVIEAGSARPGMPLHGWALALAILVLALDAIASTRLQRGRVQKGAAWG